VLTQVIEINEGEGLTRRTSHGVILSFLSLFSRVLVFEIKESVLLSNLIASIPLTSAKKA
jgi:hypothetical protein